MEINNLKAIIFDLDGTLINTDELIIASYHAVFNKYRPNYVLTREEELSFLGPPLELMFKKYFNEDFEVLLKEYRDYASKHTMELASLYPYVKELLEYLNDNNYIVCLVTSRFSSSAENMLEIFNLRKYFKMLVCLDDVINPKPSPEGILKILEKFNLKNNEVLYIGDALTDYQAGVNAQVYTGIVSWSNIDKTNIKLDILIDDYQNLERMLKNGQNL